MNSTNTKKGTGAWLEDSEREKMYFTVHRLEVLSREHSRSVQAGHSLDLGL